MLNGLRPRRRRRAHRACSSDGRHARYDRSVTDRRTFLRTLAALGAGGALGACAGPAPQVRFATDPFR
ncbi:MAG: twin-arginine translocation signal domain-containing protein, partial [Burkholderiales bacterium]|nr:twin-arginine translocation signal domain-containing protein [Burkholderiales bacterium]